MFCKKCVYLRLVPKTLAQVFFSVNFSKFLRTPFFIEHLWSLFLLLLAYLIKLVHLWIIRVRIKRFDSFLSIGYCNVFVWKLFACEILLIYFCKFCESYRIFCHTFDRNPNILPRFVWRNIFSFWIILRLFEFQLPVNFCTWGSFIISIDVFRTLSNN